MMSKCYFCLICHVYFHDVRVTECISTSNDGIVHGVYGCVTVIVYMYLLYGWWFVFIALFKHWKNQRAQDLFLPLLIDILLG